MADGKWQRPGNSWLHCGSWWQVLGRDRKEKRWRCVCVYVNRHWCCNITVKEQLCTEHLELLTVALRPYYLPREFNQLFITAVYIHPAADVKLASEGVGWIIHWLSLLSPDTPCFVLGDFNKCRLNWVLPHFKQYITCLTYKDKTNDLCYGNIPDTFTSWPLSGLGRSDHNMVHLIPAYRQKLKRSKLLTRSVKTWSKEDIKSLNGCFLRTDWSIFHTGTSSLDEVADIVSSCQLLHWRHQLQDSQILPQQQALGYNTAERPSEREATCLQEGR